MSKAEATCERCYGRGILPSDSGAVRYCKCRVGVNAVEVERQAEALCKKIQRLHPDWKHRMDVVLSERTWTYTQLLGACVAYVYERGLQMSMPADPFFAPGTPETEPDGTCALPTCSKPFKPLYPGQKFCSNECGVLALPKKRVLLVMPETPPTPPEEEAHAETTLPLYGEHDEFADA